MQQPDHQDVGERLTAIERKLQAILERLSALVPAAPTTPQATALNASPVAEQAQAVPVSNPEEWKKLVAKVADLELVSREMVNRAELKSFELEVGRRVGDAESLARTVSAAVVQGGNLYSSDVAPRGSAFRERPGDFKPRSPFGQ